MTRRKSIADRIRADAAYRGVRTPEDPYAGPAPQIGSRAPLLTPKQAARLIGGGTTGLYVRRNVPGGVRLGPRRRAWPVEAIEAYTGLSYSTQALKAVQIEPYAGGDP